MKTVAALAALSSVAAFAPTQQAAKTSVLSASFENELGVQPPLDFW